MPIRREMQARYPRDWALRSRFIRFHRARNRCEWFGIHNYSLREDTGAVVVFTVAHVYHKRLEACSLRNLADQRQLVLPVATAIFAGHMW